MKYSRAMTQYESIRAAERDILEAVCRDAGTRDVSGFMVSIGDPQTGWDTWIHAPRRSCSHLLSLGFLGLSLGIVIGTLLD